MKMINKSILALGVVALAAVNVQAAGLTANGAALKLDGTAYTRNSSDGVIALKTTGTLGTSGYADSMVTASVSGQKDFAQYRVKIGTQDYWYSILDTGEQTTTDGKEKLRQEVYVRANSTGTAGALFVQQFTSKDTGMTAACAFETTTVNNQSCLDINMDFKGLNIGSVADRDFNITMVLAEKGSGTATIRDYQQQFNFDQKVKGSATDTISQTCNFLSGANCAGTLNGTELTQTAGVLSPTTATVGKDISTVWFKDSIRVGAAESENLKYQFEAVNYDRPDDGSGVDDYRYQLF